MLSQRIARLGFSLKLAALNLAVRRLQRLPAGQSPGWLDVVLLALAWGNLGYAAGFAYLRHVGRKVAASQGPILECGSGATTLLIAALTAPRGIDFVVLEHNREWFEHLARVLRALGLGHVKLRHAPLVTYAGYRWYEPPAEPAAGHFHLVVCDGPPGSTPGGRYGLMPVMGPRLSSNCVILLDDTHRQAERRIIEMWRRYRRLSVSPRGWFGRYTEVVFA
ncbi:hypothetical protein [Panacagrimonas sp.]|uniref:hypothetical protein n=1 Tax=Panacagrimonas sp. TaxID=2480088 RepID=UPI003B524B47